MDKRSGFKKPIRYGDQVTVSDKARAATALYREFEQLEKSQLEVGEQMAVLIAKQLVLSEKCRAIKQTLGELFCEKA